MNIIDLFERAVVGHALVFHATTPQAAYDILVQDTLEAKTKHLMAPEMPVSPKHQSWKDEYNTYIEGISTTRSYRFARDWDYHDAYMIILALDYSKLRNRYKVIPKDWYGEEMRGKNGDHKMRRKEAEEFIVGDVTPLSRYLSAIYIPEFVAKRFGKMKWFQTLRQNPLSEIVA